MKLREWACALLGRIPVFAKIKRLNQMMDRAFIVIAAVSLISLMMLVVLNGIVRGIYKPFGGTVEVASWLAAITTAFAVGNAQLHRAHVSIDLLFNKFPQAVQKIVHALILILSLLFFVLLTWQLWKYGVQLKASGNLSETLRIPFYPFVLLTAIGFAGMILTCIVQFIEIFSGEDHHGV